MTAPDRLFMFEGYLPSTIRWMESKEGIGEEYIRKEAFPVEEIAQACHSSWLAEDLEDLLSRILSLLEGERG